MVKVKMEKAGGDSADEDKDEGEDGGHGASQDDTTRMAKMIYKKALKILKLKLYFENFFLTDAEKDGLPYSCWTSAVASINEIDNGSAAARRMFYDFGYDDMVRTLTSGPTLNINTRCLTTPPTPSLISASALSGAHLSQSPWTVMTDTILQRRRNLPLSKTTAMSTRVTPYVPTIVFKNCNRCDTFNRILPQTPTSSTEMTWFATFSSGRSSVVVTPFQNSSRKSCPIASTQMDT
jgi:hypothetical protein